MAVRIPRRRALERFGSYNNLRSNPYSNFERTLDLRAGILDPYTQIAQSVMQTSYGIDTLSSYGNVFRARILGVVTGKPARHLYPDLYANQQGGTESVKDHFIFVLRDESDQFAPDPSGFAASAKSYTNMIGLQGDAISEKPADEEMERYAIGDIVEVYKPEQNSWNGSLVRKVVVRNNFSADVVTGDADGIVVGGAFNTTAGEAFSGSFGGESGYVADNTGNGTGADGLTWDGQYKLNTPKAENSVDHISSRYPRLRYQLSGNRKWPVQEQLLEILQNVAADPDIDIYIDIWSGGQVSIDAGGTMGNGRSSTENPDWTEWNDDESPQFHIGPEPTERITSTTMRHDDGWAADISIYESPERREAADTAGNRGGRLANQLRATTGEPAGGRLYEIALAFWEAGITGMGAHPMYQDGRFHVDIAYCNSANPEVQGAISNHAIWAGRGRPIPSWLSAARGKADADGHLTRSGC